MRSRLKGSIELQWGLYKVLQWLKVRVWDSCKGSTEIYRGSTRVLSGLRV